MKPFPLLSPIFLYLYLLFLFTLALTCFGPNKIMAVTILGNQTDHLALLQFKESISSDPYRILDSWNESTHFCNWHGITCSPMHQRVTELNLYGSELHGSLSPYVGNLTFLKILYLRNNSFFGEIPQELGQLLHLQQLVLTNNSFAGEIPTNLTYCSNLASLFLNNNNLIGKIPTEIGSLKKLQRFSVYENNLTGGISSFLGNLSSLMAFSCNSNNMQGDIPQEICRLKNLSILLLGENKFSGTIPSCLGNISSITILALTNNRFHGSLPVNMFNTLPNLHTFFIAGNQFSGPIGTSIMNASSIISFAISENHFVGQVPSLGRLKNLQNLNLEGNSLGSNSTKDLEFFKYLTNCSMLNEFSIAGNNFGGILPNSVGNLSTKLEKLDLASNMMSGKIPSELGCLVNLILLYLDSNQFEGNIPTAFGKFQKMQKLTLNGNKLSGDIPPFLSNLSQLYHLELQLNMFGGNIPPSIGNCQKLQYLDLSHNKLRGTIPLEVFNLLSLTNLLDLSHNSLSGSLPGKVGMLKNIGKLDVSNNHLSGDIPMSIGECITLEYLLLQDNSFNGTIPSSFSFLKGLRYLDLSINRLSGSIPDVIQNISGLKHLNISFNILEGKVPTNGVFGNASQVAIIGNNKLCGGISHMRLPPCSIKDRKHTKHHMFMFVVVGVISLLLMLSIFLTIYWLTKRNHKRSSDSSTLDQLHKVSYRDLHRGTDGFSITNLIGSGNFGSVYKGNLVSEDNFVAIKVLNLQKKGAHKSFILECNALKNIRHRNLVKIVTCCSSSDYKGQEFKALVFDYMENGSLEQWLHSDVLNAESQTTLDLAHRVNIITDVASALHYLHQECEQLVIHCDLKPSNVLLDDDMVAHVSDFGLARLVSSMDGTSRKDTSTIGIKGTIGYAPPEYGMGSEVSTCGDMYSFGILMLEILTGRRPTSEVFEDGQNLHNFVAIAFPDNLINILDPSLISREAEEEIQDGNRENFIPTVEGCLISLFRIGLNCSMEPAKDRIGLNCSMEPAKERMNIVDVTRELSIIRKTFLRGVRTYN